jgi:hypothetical protein
MLTYWNLGRVCSYGRHFATTSAKELKARMESENQWPDVKKQLHVNKCFKLTNKIQTNKTQASSLQNTERILTSYDMYAQRKNSGTISTMTFNLFK